MSSKETSVLLKKDDPSYKWAVEDLERAHKANDSERIARVEQMLNEHSSDCPCGPCRELEASEEAEYQARQLREKEAYQAKKAELFSKITLKRGKVVVNPEDKEQIARVLLSIWNYIGDEVSELPDYRRRGVPRSHLIEMVLDAGRPAEFAEQHARRMQRNDKALTPAAEYVLRYSYETETRSVIHAVANETFKSY